MLPSTKDMEQVYAQASYGTAVPNAMFGIMPGIGEIELIPEGVFVDGKRATPEQLVQISKFLRGISNGSM